MLAKTARQARVQALQRVCVCVREAATDLREVLELVKNILVALRFLKQRVTCHV